VGTDSKRMAFDIVSRLEAGTSAILLDFEASLVKAVALWFLWNRRARFVNYFIFALEGSCLFAVFTRAPLCRCSSAGELSLCALGRGKFLRSIVESVVGLVAYTVKVACHRFSIGVPNRSFGRVVAPALVESAIRSIRGVISGPSNLPCLRCASIAGIFSRFED
jgi:hypothetical protein